MIRLRQLRVPVLMGFLALASLRCSEKTGPSTEATAIAMVSGDEQSGVAGAALVTALVVVVTDEQGGGVEGASVTWSAQDGGSVSAPTVTTGPNGRASVQWTLGPGLGQQTATATATNLQGSPVTFSATATEQPQSGGLTITTNPPVA